MPSSFFDYNTITFCKYLVVQKTAFQGPKGVGNVSQVLELLSFFCGLLKRLRWDFPVTTWFMGEALREKKR